MSQYSYLHLSASNSSRCLLQIHQEFLSSSLMSLKALRSIKLIHKPKSLPSIFELHANFSRHSSYSSIHHPSSLIHTKLIIPPHISLSPYAPKQKKGKRKNTYRIRHTNITPLPQLQPLSISSMPQQPANLSRNLLLPRHILWIT